MKIYLDDCRKPLYGYTLVKSVNEAKELIIASEEENVPIEVIDCDYFLNNYELDGGNGIYLLYWLNERKTYYPIEIHTSDSVAKYEMHNFVLQNWPK